MGFVHASHDTSAHHPDDRLRRRLALRRGDEGRDPLDQPGGPPPRPDPRASGRRTSATPTTSSAPPSRTSRRARSTSASSIRASASRPRPLCVEAGGQLLVGPDNGVFTRSLARPSASRVASGGSTEPRFWRPTVSDTFHGRDVFAPVAAHLSLGVDPARTRARRRRAGWSCRPARPFRWRERCARARCSSWTTSGT